MQLKTILALWGATFATHELPFIIRAKIDIGDNANSSFSDGVAIGASVSNITPGGSMIIGLDFITETHSGTKL